jgi:DNA-binding SARP family transcriptional activator
MGQDVTFRILGPLEVCRAGTVTPISGPKQRVILATLLLNAGTAVRNDTLVERLWDGRPPTCPQRALYVYVCRLRHELGGAVPIRTRSGGYLIEPAPGSLDVHRFTTLVSRARSVLRGAAGEALELLREAASLWRGPILPDVACLSLHEAEVPRLTEQFLDAVVQRFELELQLGQHREALADLTTLAAQYPMHERMQEQLMLALYRSGRRAEALARYRATSNLFRDELGLEPGAGMRALHSGILHETAT